MWAKHSYIGKNEKSNKFLEKEIQDTDTLLQSSNYIIMVVLCNACLGKVSLNAEAGWLQKTTKCIIVCFKGYTMSRTDFKDYRVKNGLLILIKQ